jgi:hypothetical protein
MGLDLTRPRELGQLVEDSWRLFTTNLRLFVTVALLIVVPVDGLVLGVGLGDLWRDYEPDPNVGPEALNTALRLLLIQPLVTAACIAAVMALSRGEEPSAGWSVARGFERWGAVLAAVLLAGLATLAGFVMFALPGIWLAVVLYFASQAVVAEDRAPLEALRRSRELVTGQWWRVFGIGLLFSVMIGVVGGTIAMGAQGAADASGRQIFMLAGTVLGDVVTVGFTAVAGTLVFFDLRSRQEGAPPPPRWAPEGWEAPSPAVPPGPVRPS